MLALVMAGTAAENALTRETGVKNKSFITLGGRPLLAYVLKALQETEMVTRIVVVGPVRELETLKDEFVFEMVPEEGSITANIHAPYRLGLLKGPVLVVTGDVPLLTKEALEDFIKACSPYDLDFYYPIIPKEAVEKKYPASRRTYVPLREGTFTGGNIFIARSEKIEESLPRVEDFFRHRKSFVKMVSKLGAVFVLKFIARRLVIEDLVQRFKVLFGIEARAVVTNYPEIGTDLDKPEDLPFFREMLGE